MTEPQSNAPAMTLAELRGMPDLNAEENLWQKLSGRIPELPDVPGGVATPAIAAALEAAYEAIEAADDTITETDALTVLNSTPEELADEEYRKALAAGDPKAKYDADRFRAKRIEVEHAFAEANRAARKAVAEASAVIKAELPNLVGICNERLAAAGGAWIDAQAAEKRTRRAYADAAQARARLLIAARENEATGSVVGNTTVQFVDQLVNGPLHVVATEAISSVRVHLARRGAVLDSAEAEATEAE